MKKKYFEKGITLIALVITIVVLLILAAISISVVEGDGIISIAKNEKSKYEQTQSKYNSLIGNLQNEQRWRCFC